MKFGSPDVQRQILSAIQVQLNAPSTFPEAWMTDGVNQDDVDAIYATLEKLKAPPYLLGIIHAWGNTITPQSVLDLLQSCNHTANGESPMRFKPLAKGTTANQ